MKMVLRATSFLTLCCPFLCLADAKAAPKFKIQWEGKNEVKAGNVALSFQLLQGKKNLKEEDLVVTHEKKLHMFLFDRSLTQFFHVHPEAKNTTWNVSFEPTHNGIYQVFSEGKHKTLDAFVVQSSVKVIEGKKELPVPTDVKVAKVGSSGDSIVTLSSDTFSTTSDSHIGVTFSRKDGTAPKITPYLGAKAHVVIVSKDSKNLIHVHPMDGDSNTVLTLHTRFHKSGDYRMWVQFIDNNELRTVPFWIAAKDEKHPVDHHAPAHHSGH